MFNKGKAKESNYILERTCLSKDGTFHNEYMSLKKNGKVNKDRSVKRSHIWLENYEKDCYFVALDDPISFAGINQYYF
jgi:hypothetical protein